MRTSFNSPAIATAPIEGGYITKTREVTIKNLLHPEIGGYFLDGFHNNGCTSSLVDANEVKPLVVSCLELLPADKLRIMFGAYSPVTTLELISIGIDLFDNSYAYLATSKHCALTFAFNEKDNSTTNQYDLDLAEER